MLSLPHITESEWVIMDTLWNESPLTAAELTRRVQAEKELAATTIKTLLRRLISKQAVAFKVDASSTKLYHYYPLVARRDCTIKQWEHFRAIYLKNNFEPLLAILSDQEIGRLKTLLEQKELFHKGLPDQ